MPKVGAGAGAGVVVELPRALAWHQRAAVPPHPRSRNLVRFPLLGNKNQATLQ